MLLLWLALGLDFALSFLLPQSCSWEWPFVSSLCQLWTGFLPTMLRFTRGQTVIDSQDFETLSCSGARLRPAVNLDERPQHGFQLHLSLSNATVFALKLDPSFIEAIEHLNARLGVLHAL
jgi:hypothetical protein